MESAPNFVLNPEHLLRGKSTCISPQKCIHWHLMSINGEECRPLTEQKENIKWQIIYLKDQRRKFNIFNVTRQWSSRRQTKVDLLSLCTVLHLTRRVRDSCITRPSTGSWIRIRQRMSKLDWLLAKKEITKQKHNFRAKDFSCYSSSLNSP